LRLRDLACDVWERDVEPSAVSRIQGLRAWDEIREDGKLAVLNAIAHQANAMWRKTVIEELAIRRFLPRYGFPIGLQSLTSPNFPYDAAQQPVSLERDGILAVSEYVPGSIVLAGGKT